MHRLISATLAAVLVAAYCPSSTAFSPGAALRLPLSARGNAVASFTGGITAGRSHQQLLRPTPLASPLRPGRASPMSLSMADAKVSGTGCEYTTADGTKIGYDFIPASSPTIVYLPGLGQTRYDSKFNALQSWCKRNNYGYFVADYYGCGDSGGEFKDGCISRWVADTQLLLRDVIKTPVILVGSGVGGWVAIQLAKAAGKTVQGIVGVAADPDFTTDIVLPSLPIETIDRIQTEGSAKITWGNAQYELSKVFCDDAEKNLLLKGGKDSIDVTCPVRLVQGLGDEEIPSDRALTLCDALKTSDVIVTYAKFGTHVMDEDEDTRIITNQIADLASKYFEYDLKSPSSG